MVTNFCQMHAEKINHLLYIDDLKLYCKSEKELDSLIQTVRIFSTDIQMVLVLTNVQS